MLAVFLVSDFCIYCDKDGSMLKRQQQQSNKKYKKIKCKGVDVDQRQEQH